MTKPAQLLVLYGDSLPVGHERLDDHPGLSKVRYATAAELADALPGADILFVWDLFSRALADAWPAADTLRWVHAATAGVDNLMLPELVAGEVVLTNSRGVFDEPIAEYVLGLVLAFAKDLPGTIARQQQRRWEHRETERIDGRHAVVVGTGPIGRAVARRLRAAGLTVSGVGRRARSGDPELGEVADMAGLHGALERADHVVLAAPLTDQTRGMIDAGALRRMRPGARLINVGRGDLVDEDALIDALRAGRIAGAALDVFASEPLAESSPLWGLPGVIVSPHMSGDTVGWKAELVDLFLDNLDRYLSGQSLRNVVDKQRGYVSD